MRIAILSNENKVVSYMDNSSVLSMHFYDDELKTYVTGSSSSFSFAADATHPSAVYLRAGYKVTFRYRNKDYCLDIVKIKQTNRRLVVTCLSLGLSLALIDVTPYAATSPVSFETYFQSNVSRYFPAILERNEISGRKRTLEFKSTESILKRLFQIARDFDAEVELKPVLKDDYTLDHFAINVYMAYDGEECFGMGARRDDIVLRYGHGLQSITREIDVTGLYTALYCVGKDGMVLNIEREVKDGDQVLYRSKDGYMKAVQMVRQFPAYVSEEGVGYTFKVFETEAETQEELYALSLAEIRSVSTPKVKYTAEGEFDSNIGDSVIAIDETFNPVLRIRARVTEITTSFTKKSKNKIMITNIKELSR